MNAGPTGLMAQFWAQQQRCKANSQDSPDCPGIDQPKARLKPHRTSVGRPEDGSSHKLPKQSDRASEDLPGRMREAYPRNFGDVTAAKGGSTVQSTLLRIWMLF